MTTPKKSMAIVRWRRTNLAEIAVYRAFMPSWDLTFFFAGTPEQDSRDQLDDFELQAMRSVRYRCVSDLVPWDWVRRGLDYKVGIGSYMLDRLDDILEHDVINITDPIFGFTRQIQRAIRPGQKLVLFCMENIPGRYDRIWTAARRAGAVMQRADMIICVTRAAQSALDLPPGFAGTVTQIYAGIDQPGSREARFTPSVASRRLAAKVADAPPVILFVGRFQRSKGLHVLLAAVQILRDRMKQDVTLWVVGGGSPGPLQALAHSLGLSGRVKFWGALSNSEVREKMAAADLFCQPSLVTPNWMEQFGFAMVEAMACGLPVVAFDSGSIREVAGEDAAYATVGDSYSLAEAIAGLLRDPAQMCVRGERLRQRAIREFDADRQGMKVFEAISGLVRGQGVVQQVECEEAST
jgi:glycosyltransferase involved in cell wall biosynthesis